MPPRAFHVDAFEAEAGEVLAATQMHVAGTVDRKRVCPRIVFVYLETEAGAHVQLSFDKDYFDEGRARFDMWTSLIVSGVRLEATGYPGRSEKGRKCLFPSFVRIKHIPCLRNSLLRAAMLRQSGLLGSDELGGWQWPVAAIDLVAHHLEGLDLDAAGESPSSDDGCADAGEGQPRARLHHAVRRARDLIATELGNRPRQRAQRLTAEELTVLTCLQENASFVAKPLPVGAVQDLGAADPLHGLRGGLAADAARRAYIENKKRPQVMWVLSRVHDLIARRGATFRHIVDVGGGRCDLAVALAASFPQTLVTVYERNVRALEHGAERQRALSLSNLSLVGGDMDAWAMRGSFDFLIGLHACGTLSDDILQRASEASAAFLVATCCFGGMASFEDKAGTLAHTGDWRTLARMADSPQADVSERAMAALNRARMANVGSSREGGNNAWTELVCFPCSWSSKNQVIVGDANGP